MEMREESFKELGQDIKFKKTGNLIDDILEVYDFLYYDCYSVPDISINEENKRATNLAWIRRNIDTNLSNIQNIRYINDNTTLEIKYLNGDVIKLFAD